MEVEVLCATMHQVDLSKYKAMNIQTDAVFSNQADRHEYVEELIDGNKVKFVTTPYRGVGMNRNLGLLYSSADILMFADDDMVYVDGYRDGVLGAFDELADADMIIFNYTSNSGNYMVKKAGRARLWNSMRFGTPNFAIKRESLLKYNLNFSQLFGGGSRYCSGEDNLFLRDAMKSGMKVYTHPYVIANINDSPSTWFRGFDEKYIFDNGAMIRVAFPLLRHIAVLYFALRFAKMSKLSVPETYKLEYAGMKAFKKGLSYDEWKRSRN
jgi:glycosyltransferase involved in cell wall biosynthesis